MANKYRNIPQEEKLMQEEAPVSKAVSAKTESKPKKKGVLAKALAGVFSGTFLANEKNFKHVPFILFWQY